MKTKDHFVSDVNFLTHLSVKFEKFKYLYKNLPLFPFSNCLQAGADPLLSKLRHPEIMEIFSGLHGEKLGPIISKKFKTFLVSCLVFLPTLLLVLWMRRSTLIWLWIFLNRLSREKSIDVGNTPSSVDKKISKYNDIEKCDSREPFLCKLISFLFCFASFSLADELTKSDRLEFTANNSVVNSFFSKPREGSSFADIIDKDLEKEFTESDQNEAATDAGSFNNSVAEHQVITRYLLAGYISGPGGFNFVSEMVQVETVAQFGVLSSSFCLGLGVLDYKRYCTQLFILDVAVLIGWCLQLCGGKSLRDCAVVLLFALLPVLGGTSGVLQGLMLMTKVLMVLIAFLAVLSILSCTWVAWFLKLMMSLSSQTNELYPLASVAFCLLVPGYVSSAFVTPLQSSYKLGLSLDLGSFASGVMISTTDLAQHALEQLSCVSHLEARPVIGVGKCFSILPFISNTQDVLNLLLLHLFCPMLTRVKYLQVTTTLLFKLYPAVINLVVLLWYPAVIHIGVGSKGEIFRSDSGKQWIGGLVEVPRNT
ncbi:hypothetical protein SADUNF_Sadunf18G0041000 [Salix dunnii]|uniref:Cation/H+ exchanger transmembrane domain-containing protein n=1 Tax=Salix dunnii TaxID=1413687 RepID=A0A835J2K2_9ROSI|nr:hypothetical protein SADUNF_Sadunf18G0041000 [Salix dunnii]